MSKVSKPGLALEGLRSVRLKRIAFLCGLGISGTKNDLARAIRSAVSVRQHKGKLSHRRVLSIDLGLRNLAYTLITPDLPKNKTSFSSPGLATLPPSVALHEWRRHELVEAQAPGNKGSTDLFSPHSMASLALELVRGSLLPLKPTHILIERQRARTMGAAAVQEWTLRVNTLETMLHAILGTMQQYGKWDGQVLSIAPARVGPFWLGDSAAEGKASGSKKVNAKMEKIELLASWLAQGNSCITPTAQSAITTKQSYLSHLARKGQRSSRSTKPSEATPETPILEKYKKVDDLADCLLQGMAWLKWEDNLSLLAEDLDLLLEADNAG